MSVSPVVKRLKPPPVPETATLTCTPDCPLRNSSATAWVTGKTVEDPSIWMVPLRDSVAVGVGGVRVVGAESGVGVGVGVGVGLAHAAITIAARAIAASARAFVRRCLMRLKFFLPSWWLLRDYGRNVNDGRQHALSAG